MRVHFLRNLLAQVPKGSAEMVAAAIHHLRPTDAEHVREQLDTIAGMLGRRIPQSRNHAAGAADITAAGPRAAIGKIWSTNPAGQFEQNQPADVVGVFSPTRRPACAWPARSWSGATTNGKSPSFYGSKPASLYSQIRRPQQQTVAPQPSHGAVTTTEASTRTHDRSFTTPRDDGAHR